MPLYRAGETLLYHAHVPKTAGSSLAAYLAARFGPPALFDPDGPPPGRRWARTSLQHLDAQTAARLLPPGPVTAFAVVRDPVARMLSEYRWRARSAARSRLAARLGFSAWLACMLEAARRRPFLFDNHFLPQARIVPEGAAVFRLEDGLAPLVAWLDARTGRPAPGLALPHANRSAQAAQGPRPSARDLALIRRAFAEDYARFGYPDPAPPPAAPRRPGAHALGRLAGAAAAAAAP